MAFRLSVIQPIAEHRIQCADSLLDRLPYHFWQRVPFHLCRQFSCDSLLRHFQETRQIASAVIVFRAAVFCLNCQPKQPADQ